MSLGISIEIVWWMSDINYLGGSSQTVLTLCFLVLLYNQWKDQLCFVSAHNALTMSNSMLNVKISSFFYENCVVDLRHCI